MVPATMSGLLLPRAIGKSGHEHQGKMAVGRVGKKTLDWAALQSRTNETLFWMPFPV